MIIYEYFLVVIRSDFTWKCFVHFSTRNLIDKIKNDTASPIKKERSKNIVIIRIRLYDRFECNMFSLQMKYEHDFIAETLYGWQLKVEDKLNRKSPTDRIAMHVTQWLDMDYNFSSSLSPSLFCSLLFCFAFHIMRIYKHLDSIDTYSTHPNVQMY